MKLKLWRSLLLGLCLSNAIVYAALRSAPQAKSQISPDGTTNTNVAPTDNVINIEGGDRAGANLFHSFEEFSVPNGSEAFFNNQSDIANIFSRVTGGDISNIDGLIRANGDASLFLINPAGIVFGEGAALDIGGSFFASTAESIVFSDDVEFSATPRNEPLLTINQPIGLNYGNNPGNIAVNNSNLEVDNGDLALLGGDVTITGGQIIAPGGNVELGGVAQNNLVELTSTNSRWLLDYQNVNDFQNVRLTNGTNITVNNNGKGSVAINANNIDLQSGSNLQAGIDAGFQLSTERAGDITLNATGIISIDDGRIANEVAEGGIGNGGNINLTGRSLFLDNGVIISTNSFGQGNTGSITINASDTFTYDGAGNSEETVISASLVGTGSGSKIAIEAPKVLLLDGATIVSHTFGQGNAGSTEINATDSILLDGSTTGIGSQVFPEAVGNGGQIAIDTASLSILNGATIAANNNGGSGNAGNIEINATDSILLDEATIVSNTLGEGNAGNIEINASKVFLDGFGSSGSSGLGSAAFELSNGDGGTIAINTDLLDVTNGATLFVSNFGEQNAGRVIINATDTVTFDGVSASGFSSNAFSTVEAETTGNGREIRITANSLSVKNGAVIGASTSGAGNGGNININVNSLQVLDGGQILTTSRSSGDAGNILINTTGDITIAGSDAAFAERLAQVGRPIVRNEGAASGIFANTDNDSTGSGGNINISTQSLFLNEGASINATNQGIGGADNTGGNITIQISDLLTLRDNSTISAQALENANGGNIKIDANFVIAQPNQNNDIIASAAEGTGGDINVTTNAIFGLESRSSTPENNTNDIDASSELGIDGTIQINELEVNPTEALEELPAEVIDVAGLVEQNLCQQGQGSEFVVTGKGGTAPSPTQARDRSVSEVDLVKPVPFSEVEAVTVKVPAPERSSEIVEAQGWVVNDRGMVELVASKTDVNGSTAQPNIQVCHQQ